MTHQKATITVDDSQLDLPIVEAVDGSEGLNIGALLKETGTVTFDNGFMNTASVASSITYIDGDVGILRHRGYPIDQLAEHSTYLETAYLLIHGELPTPEQLTTFQDAVTANMALPESFDSFFQALPTDAHPMQALAAGVSLLSAHNLDVLDPLDPAQVDEATHRLMGQLPVLAARILRHLESREPVAETGEDPVDTFFLQCFGAGDDDRLREAKTQALDLLLLLHADHEQNCSTSTVRMVGSAQANLYASVSAGVNALYGPLHGGANEAVLAMLHAIDESDDSVEDFLTRVRNKEDGVKLMGFGHRVYKNYDPRARIVKATADRILSDLGQEDSLLETAMELEKAALAEDYFVQRKLYPNVDFYTGLIYKAMGFPEKFFTVLFAVGRLPGWIAQWREMMADKATKINRPRQVYVGAAERPYPQG